jgi:hypothetical protein
MCNKGNQSNIFINKDYNWNSVKDYNPNLKKD